MDINHMGVVWSGMGHGCLFARRKDGLKAIRRYVCFSGLGPFCPVVFCIVLLQVSFIPILVYVFVPGNGYC